VSCRCSNRFRVLSVFFRKKPKRFHLEGIDQEISQDCSRRGENEQQGNSGSPHIQFQSLLHTKLWNWMMALLISFGRILLPANDEVRGQRTASCKEVFKRQSNETAGQRKERDNRRLLCRYASLGHPNKKGAGLYADAIIDLLPAALSLPK